MLADLDWGDGSNLAVLHASLSLSKASPGLFSVMMERHEAAQHTA